MDILGVEVKHSTLGISTQGWHCPVPKHLKVPRSSMPCADIIRKELCLLDSPGPERDVIKKSPVWGNRLGIKSCHLLSLGLGDRLGIKSCHCVFLAMSLNLSEALDSCV